MENELVSPPTFFHKPVLVNEVLEYLDPQAGKIYLDVTFGSGGHSRAILEKEPACKLFALDWDVISLDTYAPLLEKEFGDRFHVIFGSFSHLYKILKKKKIPKIDGILADFGTSQMQIIERPGFSVFRDKPLDMRMSPQHHKITAADILNRADERELCEIFWEFGEEKYTRKIARAIVEERGKKKFQTTSQLVSLIERVVPGPIKRYKIHPATRVFQALRIVVNKELDNIRAFLPAALKALAPGGRLVCISFHSLEDRLVKQFFREQEQMGIVRVLTKKVVGPSDEEKEANPASRSAKLRAIELIGVD